VERVSEKVETLRRELSKGLTFHPELPGMASRALRRKKQEAVFDPYADLPDIEYSDEARPDAEDEEESFQQDPEFLRRARAKAAAGSTHILYAGSPIIGSI